MIGHFFAPQLLVLYCFAIAAMIVHFRGRRRFGGNRLFGICLMGRQPQAEGQ